MLWFGQSIVALIVISAGASVAQAQQSPATIGESEFKQLKQIVEQLNEKVRKLEEARDQDQKRHEQDQRQIEQLRRDIGETHLTLTNTTQRLDTIAQVQPVHPIPPVPSASHNVTLVGDAEVQFGKVDGSHAAFAMADFAPIFLYRAGDRVLFEAGLDVSLQNNAPNYLTNTLLFEGDYEFAHSNDPDQRHNAFVFPLSYGF